MARPVPAPLGNRDLIVPWTPEAAIEATSAFAAAVPRSPGRLLRTPEPGSLSSPRSRVVSPRRGQQSTDRDNLQARSVSSGTHLRSQSSTPRASVKLASAGGRVFQTGSSASGLQSERGSVFGATAVVGHAATTLPERPLRVSDLDQSEQAESWIKRPLYYTHHRKKGHEQLSQVIQLPPMQRNQRFKASEGASWDCIAENAFQAMQQHPEKHLHVVVLLYCLPCNPFHLGDVDILKRARTSLDALPDVSVIGALVVPSSDATLRENSVAEDRRLPYSLRRDLARCVLKAADQTGWVIVDTCLEGCMKNVPGSIAPFVSVYARGRLHGRGYETRVVEVKAEDPLLGIGSRGARPFDHFHVSPGTAGGPAGGHLPSEKPGGQAGFPITLDTVGTLIIDVPKQTQCDDLIWSSVKSLQELGQNAEKTRQVIAVIERFCGTGGARQIMEWASSRGLTRGKTKLTAD